MRSHLAFLSRGASRIPFLPLSSERSLCCVRLLRWKYGMSWGLAARLRRAPTHLPPALSLRSFVASAEPSGVRLCRESRCEVVFVSSHTLVTVCGCTAGGVHNTARASAVAERWGAFYISPPVTKLHGAEAPTGALTRPAGTAAPGRVGSPWSLQHSACSERMHPLPFVCRRGTIRRPRAVCAAALSWLRRRGPGLPNGLLRRLFRLRKVLRLEPGAPGVGSPRRTPAHAPLPEGARLLIPKAFAAAAPALASRAAGAHAWAARAHHAPLQPAAQPALVAPSTPRG